ncbi:hypothetical protein Ao3042_00454 [Aspergillus oryzae 3.042]|uniref:Transmembrane protein n=1 Tax=Aspergillus oryzae (strain 3.042) TaxID=1160506 RepID=I8IST8_ASPO3|nr:hypothetical protein Ao3042_00454 [Aspergillus oryzae 3.042]|eukprot:EIT82461.1 hypothetical protein Ao3042_00454 [Aspergillus oryzae 3.042]
MPFTIEAAHLWKAFVLMLIWVVTNSSRPLFVVFFDWLSVHFKHWLERMWPLPEGGSPEARPDQDNKGSVGAEESEEGKKKKGSLGDSEEESDDESEGGVKLSEGSVGEKKRAWRRVWRVVEEEKKFVRSDLPGYGLLAQTKDILKPRVEKLRHWRGLRREVDLEKGVRGRSKSAGPVPHQSQPKATQVEASGGAAPGDLNAIVSGLHRGWRFQGAVLPFVFLFLSFVFFFLVVLFWAFCRSLFGVLVVPFFFFFFLEGLCFVLCFVVFFGVVLFFNITILYITISHITISSITMVRQGARVGGNEPPKTTITFHLPSKGLSRPGTVGTLCRLASSSNPLRLVTMSSTSYVLSLWFGSSASVKVWLARSTGSAWNSIVEPALRYPEW